LTAGQDRVRPATQLATDIAIEVTGVVARVAIAQRFRNDSSDWVEGIYVFPLPDDAAVDRLTMRIGDRRIEGEIQERGEAKRTYERARDAGQRASLVEQERPNLFTTSIANIPPGQEIEIEIGYLQMAAFEQGEFSLRLPMTLTPRFIPGAATGSGAGGDPRTTAVPDASRITPPVLDHTSGTVRLANIAVTVDAGATLIELASRTHLTVTRGVTSPYRLEPATGPVPMDRDFVVHWRLTPEREPRGIAFTETIDGEDYALLIFVPPATAEMPELTPREMIFIIDTSGSMGGTSIEQAKAALHSGLASLRGVDRFNIIAFADEPSALNGAPVLFSVAALEAARGFVDRLRADGGTNMEPALTAAFAGTPPTGYLRQIVFITDGSVGNEAGLFRLISEQLGESRLFTVGIGSAPNTHFMRKAAQFGRGTHLHIARADAVESGMRTLFDKIGHIALRDITIDWPDAVEAYPARIPDLFRGEPVVVAARLARPLTEPLEVVTRGQAGSYEWSQTVSIEPGTAAGAGAIWARRKIEALLDRKLEGESDERVRAAVLEVALAHGTLSPYTSLVAVDREPELTRMAALRREALGNMLPAGSDLDALYSRLPQTATHAKLLQITGVILTALLLGLFGIWRLTRKLPL
jgi:Ca-activated chloride channel family protein